MSWDILIQDLPPVASVAEVPNDFEPAPLGPRQEVIARIRGLLPDVDFSSPGWGVVDRGDWAVEVNLGPDEPVRGIMLHVRGGQGALDTVRRLVEGLPWPAIDTHTGELYAAESAEASFGAWRGWRDRVVGEGGRQ